MKYILLLLIFFLAIPNLYSQTTEPSGKVFTEIFTNFHYNIKDSLGTTGFGIERAFLGYTYVAGNNFSATVILNAGSPDDVADGSEPRRYVHLREAFINYTKDKLSVNLGISKTLMADYQQRFHGKRYISDTYQTLNDVGYVSDLGLAAIYRFSEVISADLTVMNGKGYSNLQSDNNLKSSLGLYITPSNTLVFRLFGDIMKKDRLWQSTILGFAGFKNERLSIGAEVLYKNNFDIVGRYDLWGYSGTGSFSLSEKTEIFMRYDHTTSTKSDDSNLPWNILRDTDFLIAGLQYTFNTNVKIAFNYQGTTPASPEVQNTSALFMNALFKF
jgi:hypothetical protein